MGFRRLAPTLVAGVLAAVYVIVSPPSFDLAAHLLRAKLFDAEGFGIWSNWWYGGHNLPGYSVLFPAVSAALSPQLAAGIAATLTATVFEAFAHRHFGSRAWLGALWFGAATATDLFTGRLAFAFGLLPALASALALQRSRPRLACALALLSALCSPVAALFAALAGVASAIGAYAGTRRVRGLWPGIAVASAALAPVGLLAIAFPEGGSEPFTFSTLWPVPVIAVVALLALGRREWTLKAGIALYTLGCIASFEIATPVGSNAARLGPLLAGPLAALLWWRRHTVLLLAATAPLLYIQWQPPFRDVTRSAGDPSASRGYYQPLLSFLARQPGPPFRVEIPFTGFHWEAYEVAPRFPLARGWERQLDIEDNPLFYGSALTPATYQAWLRELAVRFVAVSNDVDLDYSAHKETGLIDAGLPYLRLAFESRHWRVYAVHDATPIVSGAAILTTLGPDSLTLRATRAGPAFVRVRFSPYWKLSEAGAGCVAPAGGFTRLRLARAGPVRLVIGFSLRRIGARSPRCS
ncbi:MAG: hypothetical protein DLM64_13910 [Solirubrobacterales bacterium]|nr:MAG: hypothetical protein DLM64_13910 [Solirubrobacterales bacterium]